MAVESGYNPGAIGGVGEIRLMQILPSTARMLGFGGSLSELAVPATNIHYGVMYLAEAWRLAGGDLCTAVMKYRAGHGETRFSYRSVDYCVAVRSKLIARGFPVTGSVPVATFGEPGGGGGGGGCRKCDRPRSDRECQPCSAEHPTEHACPTGAGRALNCQRPHRSLRLCIGCGRLEAWTAASPATDTLKIADFEPCALSILRCFSSRALHPMRPRKISPSRSRKLGSAVSRRRPKATRRPAVRIRQHSRRAAAIWQEFRSVGHSLSATAADLHNPDGPALNAIGDSIVCNWRTPHCGEFGRALQFSASARLVSEISRHDVSQRRLA
jgi:hypothetical protein